MNMLSIFLAAVRRGTQVSRRSAVFFLVAALSAFPLQAQSDDDLFEDLSDEEREFLEELLSEEEKTWTMNASLRYRTRQVQNGVEMSTQPLLDGGLALFHKDGFSAGANLSQRIADDPGFQNAVLSAGYTLSVAEWLDLGAEYSRFIYPSSTINPLAGSQNLITLNADLIISRLILSTSYDWYFGEDAAKYLSFSGLLPFRIGELRLNPLVSLTFSSYEIQQQRARSLRDLLRGRGRTETVSETGLSAVQASLGLSYPLGAGFALTFTPVYAYTPQENLASQRLQFFFSAGLRYSTSF